jgi:AcrR family transcriptional regulator
MARQQVDIKMGYSNLANIKPIIDSRRPTRGVSGATVERRAPVRARNAREELLDAADTLMLQRNSLDISLSEIAGVAGVNSAMVKYHFGNKRGLLIALVERNIGDSMASLQALVDAKITATEKMRHHISGVINLYFRYKYLSSLQLSLVRDSTPAEAQDITERMLRPAADAQRKILKQGLESGEFRPIDPMLFFFRSSVTMKEIFGVTEIDHDLRRKLIDHTVNILMNGIVAK